jgi:hypothetical protein
VPYSIFCGAPKVSETIYEHHRGLLVRTVTTTEPDWTDYDRGLVLALLAEQKDTCPSCGHLMSVCRDPATAGTWHVREEICQPSRILQAVAEDVAKSKPKRRGVMLASRRT